MEIWKAKKKPDGALERSASCTLIKSELASIFLMGKSEGAGAGIAPAPRNGDWVYAAYGADGKTPAGPPAAACRGCHLGQASTDWVFGYNEYFTSRSR